MPAGRINQMSTHTPEYNRIGSRLLFFCVFVGFSLRLAALLAFRDSVLFEPIEGGGHDRSIYQQAIAAAGEGSFFPEGAFEFLPLYPWLMGLLAAVTGYSPVVAAIVGITCDSITVAMIILLACRIGARPWLAAAAGLLYAGYPLAVIYSLLTMPNTLNAMMVTAFVYMASVLKPSGWKRAAGLGLMAGAAALGFAGMLLVGAAVVLVWVHGASWRHRLALTAAFAAGLVLPLAPVAWHNSRAEGRFVLLTTHGGFNLYMGNHERATGYPLRVLDFRMTARDMLEDAHRHAERMSGQGLTRAESSDWWSRKAKSYWSEEPAKALALTLRKVMLFWNGRDVDDLRMLEQLRLIDPFFRSMPGTPFALFGFLGLTGLFFARRAGVPRAALLAGMTGLVLFFITARYRLTLVPVMAVLGAGGLTVISGHWRAGMRKRSLWLMPLAGLVLFPFSMRDQGPVDHYNVAIQLISSGREGEAMEIVRQGLERYPEYPDLHFAHGSILYKANRFGEAAMAYQQALLRNPNHPTAVFNLALSLARAEEYCAARDVLAGALDRGVALDARARQLLAELAAACP